MVCPYKEELEKGTIMCDTGYQHSPGRQCPTETFNKCQEEANNEARHIMQGGDTKR